VLVSVVVQLQRSPATNKLSSRRAFIIDPDNWDNFGTFAMPALTNIRTFAGKATLPEPWEVAAHVCYASKPKSLNRLAANVGDGFFNGIRRVNQV
jgi:hypothetical protein